MKAVLLALASLPAIASAQPDQAPPPVWLAQAPVTARAIAADSDFESDTSAESPARAPKAAGAARAGRGFRSVFRTGLDDVLAEVGKFSGAPEARTATALRLSPYLLWQPHREWEFRAGAGLDGDAQRGGAADYTRWRGDLADTYVRYRSGDTRLTAGSQTILWGRVDEVSIIDRVSRTDLTRFAIDKLPERRSSQLALRWEQTFDDYKLDAVVMPAGFRGARLPDTRSVWSPLNRGTGQIIGVAPNPALAPAFGVAPLDQEDGGAGGAALRLTRTGALPFDFGVTLSRTRQSLPYFRLEPAPLRLVAEHPYQSFVGIDMEWATGNLVWRTELGYTADQRVTATTGTPLESGALDWAGSVEFFPGGKDLRVSLQLLAHKLNTDSEILELKDYLGLSGEIEAPLDQGRWKLSTRFFSGLNVHDVYVSPRISFLAWEPHEIYLTARYFAGEDRALGGFHRDHGQVAIGIRSRF